LHVVTDDEILSRPEFLDQARRVLETGGPDLALHLRGPRTSGGFLHTLAGGLRPKALETTSPLLANDRVDIAMALELSGVHLGQRSLPPDVTRAILGPRKLVGLSVHGAEEAKAGMSDAVDFFIVGTIYSSPSHGERVGAGTARIREIRQMTRIPLFAIGGVTPDRVEEVLGAGAFGVAVRGGIWDAEDPQAAVGEYLEELEKGKRR
jgi:thiamine-phosphate diphosphorylase